MGDALNRKKRSRAGYRGRLRKLAKDITECVNNFDENNINHVSRLNALKNNFSEPLKNIETADTKFIEIANSLAANDRFYEVLSKIDV